MAKGESLALPSTEQDVMDPARWKKIDEMIDAALELPESERESFVDREAGDDHDLRDQVIHLLAAKKKATHFFSNPQ